MVTFLHYSNTVILSPIFQTSSYFEPIWLGKSGFQWVPLSVLLGWISPVKPSSRVVHSRERRNLSREWATQVRLKFSSFRKCSAFCALFGGGGGGGGLGVSVLKALFKLTQSDPTQYCWDPFEHLFGQCFRFLFQIRVDRVQTFYSVLSNMSPCATDHDVGTYYPHLKKSAGLKHESFRRWPSCLRVRSPGFLKLLKS